MNFKILWVEKDDFINSPLEDVLKLEAFNVIWTDEGKCAIQIAQEMQPNVIISRLNVNDYKTQQFIERLGQNEVTAKIPLIVITPDETEEGDRLPHFIGRKNQYWIAPKKVRQMIQYIVDELIC